MALVYDFKQISFFEWGNCVVNALTVLGVLWQWRDMLKSINAKLTSKHRCHLQEHNRYCWLLLLSWPIRFDWVQEVTQNLRTYPFAKLRCDDRTPIVIMMARLELFFWFNKPGIIDFDKASVKHLLEVVEAQVRISPAILLDDTDDDWINIGVYLLKLPLFSQSDFPICTVLMILELRWFDHLSHRFYFSLVSNSILCCWFKNKRPDVLFTQTGKLG